MRACVQDGLEFQSYLLEPPESTQDKEIYKSLKPNFKKTLKWVYTYLNNTILLIIRWIYFAKELRLVQEFNESLMLCFLLVISDHKPNGDQCWLFKLIRNNII